MGWIKQIKVLKLLNFTTKVKAEGKMRNLTQ